jgi:hypothetical protein
VLYYSVVLRIATRLSRAQNPKDAQCWTEFCDYRAFSAVFKSFRVLSRNGKSVRENYLREMAGGGHSQRLWESRPRREVRECTCLDGEALQFCGPPTSSSSTSRASTEGIASLRAPVSTISSGKFALSSPRGMNVLRNSPYASTMSSS